MAEESPLRDEETEAYQTKLLDYHHDVQIRHHAQILQPAAYPEASLPPSVGGAGCPNAEFATSLTGVSGTRLRHRERGPADAVNPTGFGVANGQVGSFYLAQLRCTAE